jgi:uncharacterized membrane protein
VVKRGKKVKKGFRLFPRSMKAKHKLGDIVPVSGIYECSICENLEAFKKGEHFSQCQDCINSKRNEDNEWYATNELRYFISKNIENEFDRIQSISIKVADKITEYAGTIGFFLIHVLWFSTWVLAGQGYFGPEYVFDPFPFGLLTMIVSLEAIFLSTFILMSQNVAAKKAEMRSEHEYQLNLETEKNVAEILAMVKDIRTEGNLRTEHIEDIKESIEDISDHIESDDNLEELKDKISEAAKIEDKLEEHIEEHEKTSYEEQEKLLDEIGIDMVVESAPTAILEEENIIDSDDDKKEEKEKEKSKAKEKQSKKDKSARKTSKKISQKSSSSKKSRAIKSKSSKNSSLKKSKKR